MRELVLDIFSDDNKTGTTKPGVIMIHGGGWRSDDRDLMYPLAGYLAEHGYIAVPVEYRLSPEASYPAAVDDINSAVTWIREHGQNFGVDTSKIAILGCSAGGQLAGLIGLKYGTYSDTEEKIQKKINAIIDIDGIMDFTSKDARRYEDDSTRAVTSAGAWFGGRYAEKKELWHEASPVFYVNENSPPIQFINSSIPRFHIGRDEVVEKLSSFSIYYEIKTLKDAPHCFWLFEPWYAETTEYVVQFLDKIFKGRYTTSKQ